MVKDTHMQHVLHLMKYIETFRFDSQLCWPLVSTMDHDPKTQRIEIFWQSTPTSQEWKLKLGSAVTPAQRREAFLNLLMEHIPDRIELFTSLLTKTVLTQAVLASTMLNEARELLGEGAVEDAIKSYHAFSQELIQAVQHALGDAPPRKPKLSLVKATKPSV